MKKLTPREKYQGACRRQRLRRVGKLPRPRLGDLQWRYEDTRINQHVRSLYADEIEARLLQVIGFPAPSPDTSRRSS